MSIPAHSIAARLQQQKQRRVVSCLRNVDGGRTVSLPEDDVPLSGSAVPGAEEPPEEEPPEEDMPEEALLEAGAPELSSELTSGSREGAVRLGE